MNELATSEAFYQAVYCVNGKSFNGLTEYENMALQKFWQLVQIHINAVEAERAAIEKARKKPRR